jgi:hypothetical protein
VHNLKRIEQEEIFMSKYTELSVLTGIKEWWFEVADGRPLLTPPMVNLNDLRMYTYNSADESEEKFVGYLTWVNILDTLVLTMKTAENAEFILRNSPPWYTKASAQAKHLKQHLEAKRHRHAYRRELLETEGAIANFSRQLELTETFEESYEVYSLATHRCPAVIEAIFEKMVTQSKTIKQLQEVHSLSLSWYSTKLSSLRKMIIISERKR